MAYVEIEEKLRELRKRLVDLRGHL